MQIFSSSKGLVYFPEIFFSTFCYRSIYYNKLIFLNVKEDIYLIVHKKMILFLVRLIIFIIRIIIDSYWIIIMPIKHGITCWLVRHSFGLNNKFHFLLKKVTKLQIDNHIPMLITSLSTKRMYENKNCFFFFLIKKKRSLLWLTTGWLTGQRKGANILRTIVNRKPISHPSSQPM